MESEHFSPKDFLKARRPEKFSDTIKIDTPVIDRSMLEYYIDTITNRNDATDFETFARKLAEHEICPNLLPQTGPTGGGDSKVDSETYPVSDAISLVWYVGIGREASSERWAFAFSAKRDWRSKAQSDITKIAETNRNYTKAFFISNQYIPDKSRAEVEDELSKRFNFDVRILDRTWILDKVFKNGHESLVIDTLKLSGFTKKEVKKGPEDIRREGKLEKIEKRIEEVNQQGLQGLQFVDDCIQSAILSRSLEQPRVVTDGKFQRAVRVAKKFGTLHQQIESIYQWAWATFWWFEDYEQFSKLYSGMEELITESDNTYDLELHTNLWFLLHSLYYSRKLDITQSVYEERTSILIRELERLSNEESRISSSLQAKTHLLLVELALKSDSKESLECILNELKSIIEKSKNLVGFPIEHLVDVITEFGEFLNGLSAYEELFETLITIDGSRKDEITRALLLLKRGVQNVKVNKPYDAINYIGRALFNLYKDESRDELVRALYLCAHAYERVGLFWAARGTLLHAAAIAIDEFKTYSELTLPQFACFRRLKWIELQLGRIPHSLIWHELDLMLKNALISQGYENQELSDGEIEFDAILGIMLLKTNFSDLKWLTTIPNVLDKLGLTNSAVALLYSLGYEEEVPDYKAELGQENEKVLYDFFLKWRDQPAADDLPITPFYYIEKIVHLETNILGCHILVETDKESPCIDLAESILAALESLLATGTIKNLGSREPVLKINIKISDFSRLPFEFKIEESDGRPLIKITCSKFDHNMLSQTEQTQIKDNIYQLLVAMFARIILTENLKQTIENLFREEHAFERSLNFTGSFVVTGNTLGENPKYSITSWSDNKAQEYPLKRSIPWDDSSKNNTKDDKNIFKEFKTGNGDPPQELLNRSQIKHQQIATISLIREVLWNQAKWSGTAFLVFPDRPPILAPMFKDTESAKQIFDNWRNELGQYDEMEQLRVSIILDINKNNPFAYRMVIGSDLNNLPQRDIKFFILVTRIQTMTPSTDINLKRFLKSYESYGYYFLLPAILPGSSLSDFFFEQRLLKRKLYVRKAWEIGRHDPDSCGVLVDDEPIIPSTQKNPPIIELLNWKKQNEKED